MLSLMSAEPPPDSVHPVTAVNLLNSRSWTWVDVLALCPRRLPPGNFSSHLRIIDRLISTHGRQYLCNTEGLSRRPRAPIRPYVSRSDLPTARIGNRRLCAGVNSRLQTFLRHRSIPLTCRRPAISFIAGRPGLRAVGAAVVQLGPYMSVCFVLRITRGRHGRICREQRVGFR